MSKIIYLGLTATLSKIEYGKEEIFSCAKFPNSLYFQDGILFDKVIDDRGKRRIGNAVNECEWYEIKCMVLPFERSKKIVDDMPDLYEASRRITEWFVDFLKQQMNEHNQPYLLQRWHGDQENKKTKRKSLPINCIGMEDYEIPYDTLLELKA